MPTRILIIAEGQLGDLLILTPAVRALKNNYSDAEIYLLIISRRSKKGRLKYKRLEDILLDTSNNPFATNVHVKKIFSIDHEKLHTLTLLDRIKAEIDIISMIRKLRLDIVICAFAKDRFYFWSFLSGASVKVGERKKTLSWLLNKKVKFTKEKKGVLEYYMALVEVLGIEEHSRKTEYFIEPDSITWMENFIEANEIKGKKIISIHPGASGNYKIWPPELFVSLINMLNKNKELQIILCGGPEDEEIISSIKSELDSNVVFINTNDSLQKLAAIFRKSVLCITNDSGPRHLAIAVGTKSLSLFRKYHDQVWNVYPDSCEVRIIKGIEICSRCPDGTCKDLIPENQKFGSFCMRMIKAENVYDSVISMISN